MLTCEYGCQIVAGEEYDYFGVTMCADCHAESVWLATCQNCGTFPNKCGLTGIFECEECGARWL